MKLSCLQEELKRGLTTVGRAVPGRTTLPSAKNILFSTEKSRLKLTATNLAVSITTWIPASVEEEGEVTVPANIVTELVSSLQSDRVAMEVPPDTLVMRVECGHSRANINGAEPADFPPIPDFGEEPAATIESGELKKAIGRTAFAVATDESRPIMGGVEVTLEEDRFKMTGCDGFRLAVSDGKLTGPVEKRTVLVVPAKTLSDLARGLADSEDPVEITIAGETRHILFRTGDPNPVKTTSVLLQGDYPSYEQIIPKQHQTRTVFDTNALQQAVRTTAIFAKNSNNMIHMDIKPEGKGRVLVSSKSDETGSTCNEVIPESLQGEPLSISFNGEYLQSAIGALGSSKAVLETNTDNSPGAFRPMSGRTAEIPDGEAGENEAATETTEETQDQQLTGERDYVHVIMPMLIGRTNQS